jgi:polygalacturonase
MRSSLCAAAAVLPAAILACENPDTHACASAFANNQASASAFCATYTAGSTEDIPSLFSSNCDESKDIESGCTCFVTGSGSVRSDVFASPRNHLTKVL